MCIISGPIRSVDGTRIFVLPSRDNSRQMTFYLNSVDSPDENMMILPVPNIDSIELHKIRYKAMFDDLYSSVLRIPQRSWHDSIMSNTLRCAASIEPLPVISHGSYLVSVVPTLEDLNRLDASVFDMTEELYNFFAKNYTREFGYLCCRLKEGKTDYEPICYSHDLHSNGRLFVPTLHYHNHHGRVDTEHADWDHLIYSVGTSEHANLEFLSRKTNKLLWQRFPEPFRYAAEMPIRCAELTGNQPNRDIAFALAPIQVSQ